MSSQRRTAIRHGNSSRSPYGTRVGTNIRNDARVERLVSIEPGENVEVNRWLMEASRRNPTMKTARNLGGLSLTLFESRDLRPAFVKKYADYGKVLGMTLMYQQEIAERFDRYVSARGWGKTDSAIGARLNFLGPKKGDQSGPLCFSVTDRRVLEQHRQILDYLVRDEGLSLPPQEDEEFLPHITINTARFKDTHLLSLPPLPRHITLGPPTLATYASKTITPKL